MVMPLTPLPATSPLGFGWPALILPTALIRQSLPLIRVENEDGTPNTEGQDLARRVSSLLDPTFDWTRRDLDHLRIDLLKQLDTLHGMEGLIGIQAPPVSGQTTGGEEEPDLPEIHTLTALAAGLTVLCAAYIAHSPPKPVSGGQA